MHMHSGRQGGVPWLADDDIGNHSNGMTPGVIHSVTRLDDRTFRHELTFALGHDSRLELVTPDGEVRKSWTTEETGLTQWDGTHVDERDDLVWRMACGELVERDDFIV
jgi:hypothetical protein